MVDDTEPALEIRAEEAQRYCGSPIYERTARWTGCFRGHQRRKLHFQWLPVSTRPRYSTIASVRICGERCTAPLTASPSTTSSIMSRRCCTTSASQTHSTVTECPLRKLAGTWHGCSEWRPVGRPIGLPGRQR